MSSLSNIVSTVKKIKSKFYKKYLNFRNSWQQKIEDCPQLLETQAGKGSWLVLKIYQQIRVTTTIQWIPDADFVENI